MTKRRMIFASLILTGSAILCGAQAVKMADLDPELREAVQRDVAQCASRSEAAAKNGAPATAPAADTAAGQQPPIDIQSLHGAGGRLVGVIAIPSGGCHCRDGNCTAYVYLKSQESYRLALKQEFASLHAMKSYKHGMPSLTGRHAVSSSVYETAVFDWDGSEYQATLCAKVTQGKDPRRPAIVKQECRKQ